jgi:tripartite ATP-independent transporter DctP family solute receptor
MGFTAMADELPDASGDPEVTLVFAEVNPLDTIIGQFDSRFAEELEKLSGGSVKIDMQSSGVLGAEGDVLDNITGGIGTIDMARISVSTLTGYGAPKAVLLSLPFAFESHEHFWNFANSDAAQECLDEAEENGLGLRGICYAEEGFRHMFFNKEVTGIDDLKGLKIRVSTDPTMVAMINAFGASATVVSYNELYSSLQTGVVDGAENPLNNYKLNAFDEVAKWLVLDGHQLGVSELIIADSAWDKLTDAQKACIFEAAKIAQDFDHEIVEEGEASTLETLKEEGIVITEVEDKTPWTDAVKDVIADATADYTELWDAIQACK